MRRQERLALAAFDSVRKLSCLDSGLSDLEFEMALMELQACVFPGVWRADKGRF